MSWLISLLVTWFIAATALWIAAKIVPGISVASYSSAFWVAILFACLNVLIGWLLWTVIAIGSLGLGLLLAFITRLVINAILLMITASLTDKFEVDGFFPAFVGAIVISVSTGFFEWILKGYVFLN